MKTLTTAVAMLFALSVPAFAETVHATVTYVNSQDNSLVVAPKDAGDLPDQMSVAPDRVDFQGISSLDQLQVGEDVVLEGEKTKTGFEPVVLRVPETETDTQLRSLIGENESASENYTDGKGRRTSRAFGTYATGETKSAADETAGSRAAEKAPVEKTGYKWYDKLGRGALNVVSSPVEIIRSIQVDSQENSLAYGWTVGLIRGFGQGVVRIGVGLLDVVTFPFDFPVKGKAPLVYPEYVWEKPGVKYI
ncbi:MAG TPA: exosortase system-associated protein, TIGR04073 family [Verrucomicrobiae bacterium]|jgi:putative exosortase-associated protein (TIGR04073 family)|nr:exosortase system-associated protein, TIGR04073 family [Verrucomicrobiae bacterium]